jgi:ABC-type uncharacterized transport system substrate-binding protein
VTVRRAVPALGTALVVLLGVHGPAAAQPAGSMARVGVLSPFLGPDNAFFDTLRHDLRERGHVEGRNVQFVYRAAESFDQLQAHAAEMVRLNVAVIVTAGPQGVRAAMGATRTIPIVMGNVGDAVDQGFIASLARPGGNVTGVSSLNTELSAKRLELIKTAFPAVSRIALLREAAAEAAPLTAVTARARALGITLQVFQVRDADELPSAFVAMSEARVGAIEMLPSAMFVSQLRRLVELAQTAKIPAMFPDARFVRAGGLMSYGPNVIDLYGLAAGYVDRILKGAKPADLPVEQPTNFALAVNTGAARRLGVTLPQTFLVRADEIVP